MPVSFWAAMEFLVGAADSFIVSFFICTFFGSDIKKKKGMLNFLIGGSLLTLLKLILGFFPPFDNFTVLFGALLTFLFALLCLNGRVMSKLFCAVFSYFLPNLITLTVAPLLSKLATDELYLIFNRPSPIRLAAYFLGAVLTLFIFCLILKYSSKKTILPKVREWGVTALVTICSYVSMAALYIYSLDGENDRSIILAQIGIIAADVICFAAVFYFSGKSDESARLLILRQQLEYRRRYSADVRAQYEQMRQLRHDMKHILSTAVNLIDSDPVSAREYLEKVMDKKLEPAAGGVYSGCLAVDAVLSEKKACCSKNGIAFRMMTATELDGIDETDICVLLSNLLDNAINGCDGALRPTVSLEISRRKAYVIITVSNTIKRSVLADNPRLISTNSGAGHGYGIPSVKSIAKKYSGTVDFYEKENIFTAEVILYAGE